MSTATASRSGAIPLPAQEPSRALAAVRQLLEERGFRSYPVQTITLKLSDNGRPITYGLPDMHEPELVVRGDGAVTATVSMGERSGCYLVSLRGGPVHTAREAQEAADLILAARPGGGS
ncbi:hypothetical protein GCM10022252_75210 [Streptosporangium oxazolinicum]|uniref:Uncharacterized protein n=1 Tax=Streptosporangium oxazolinicum TaxID=909287 RepID=A0ABP8BKF0_9ACTN